MSRSVCALASSRLSRSISSCCSVLMIVFSGVASRVRELICRTHLSTMFAFILFRRLSPGHPRLLCLADRPPLKLRRESSLVPYDTYDSIFVTIERVRYKKRLDHHHITSLLRLLRKLLALNTSIVYRLDCLVGVQAREREVSVLVRLIARSLAGPSPCRIPDVGVLRRTRSQRNRRHSHGGTG